MLLKRIVFRIPTSQLYVAQETSTGIGCSRVGLGGGVVEARFGEVYGCEVTVSGRCKGEGGFGAGFETEDGREGG